MADLLREFFRRDLSLEEFDALVAELDSSEWRSWQMARAAARAYARTGLPRVEPSPGFNWLGLGLGLLALAGAAAAWVVFMGTGTDGGLKPSAPSQVLEPRSPAPAPKAQARPRAGGPKEKPREAPVSQAPQLEMRLLRGADRRLSLEVNLSTHSPLPSTLEIRDAQGGLARTLHQGRLAPGRWRFEWDLRRGDGKTVAPDIYYIRFLQGSQQLSRAVEVEAR